jgi:geranylgeranyl diphosphate synthase type II
MSNKKVLERILKEFEQLGENAYKIARDAVLREGNINYIPLREAIKHFIDLWRNFQHPALLAIACKTVGGEPEKTTTIGAALVLLTGAADIHDDIIDKSKTKGSKETLYGKFGQNISIIAGDILFIEGLTLLNMACRNLPKEQSENVQNIIKQGFFELGTAEAEEASFKGDWELNPEKYLDIIRRKSAIAEAAARVGAMIGGAAPEEVENWAC